MDLQTLKTSDGLDLSLVKNIPQNPKAMIVIVHGLAEHNGRYDYVVSKFNSQGFGVYRFDNRGHGKSQGERGYVESFHQYIDDTAQVVDVAVAENTGLPVFVLGHSMGGFIATGFAIKYNGKAKGQIFSGAAVRPLPAFDFLKDMDYKSKGREMLPNALGHLVSRDQNVVKAYADDPLVLKKVSTQLAGTVWKDGVAWIAENVSKIKVPALILHGDDDKIVPASGSVWLNETISSSDKTLKLYKGLYHEILNEKEKDEVLKDIFDWINKHI